MADETVLKIFEDMKALHIAKDADYAGKEPLSNFKGCEAFGIPAWKGCLIRLSDKYSRLVSLVAKGGDHAVEGEGLEDTLMDMAVYSVLVLALLRKECLAEPNKHGQSVDGEKILPDLSQIRGRL